MRKFRLETTSAMLHIMAMFFMLLDHMWATILAYDWMTCVGRIAFPIFAFMIAEGFKHTKNLKKYALRLLIFAVISELPFNLMYGNQLFYPMHQNVMWTFLIAIGGMTLMEKAKSKGKLWITILVTVLVFIAGLILGYVLFVDYYGCGVVTVFIFYIFDRDHEKNIVSRILKDNQHQKLIWTLVCLIGQFVCLYYINVEILGGFYYNVTFLGFKFELIQQELALLALIPIWLYRGKQGYHATWFKYFNYAFYPVHCLILALLAMH